MDAAAVGFLIGAALGLVFLIGGYAVAVAMRGRKANP